MKTGYFYSHIGLGMYEGVGEDSRHGFGHVDIRVGSWNCLNVIVFHACALRWGVTHIGNYLYWALLTMSRDHHFRYRKRSGRRHSLVKNLKAKTLEEFRLTSYFL